MRKTILLNTYKQLNWLLWIHFAFYVIAMLFLLIYYLDNDKSPYLLKTVLFVVIPITIINLLAIPIVKLKASNTLVLPILFLIDIIGITILALITGGYSSVFITYYLMVIMVAPIWLSRRLSALFASIATIGIAFIGTAHLLKEFNIQILFSEGLLNNLPNIDSIDVITKMLVMTIVFFIAAYISGVFSEKLSSIQSFNDSILESMAEGVGVFDLKGRLVFANKEFSKIFFDAVDHNISYKSIDIKDIFSDDDDDEILNIFANTLEVNKTIIRREPDNKKRPALEIRIGKITNKNDKTVAKTLIATDLTTRKRMEQAEKIAEKFNAVSEMATGLAHEIRNPLASVKSAIQEISIDLPYEGDKNKLFNVVVNEIDHLDSIISRFLQFSRNTYLTSKEYSIDNIINEVTSLISCHPNRGKIQIVTNHFKSSLYIYCDQEIIKESILNICLNALNAMQKVGVLGINIQPEKNSSLEDGVAIIISDTGKGIDKKNIDKIFSPFYTTSEKGTGLGLPTAKKNIEAHGGEIKIIRNSDKGVTFKIWLPINKEAKKIKAAENSKKSITRIYTLESDEG